MSEALKKNKVKVLLVEDEVIIADSIVMALEDYGYELMNPVGTFSDAVASIENEIPDIAIVDITLSGKKNGIDLGILINEVYKFPFIYLTSNSDKLTLEQAKKSEPLAYLVKPFNKKELFASIEIALYNFAKFRQNAIDESNLIIKDSLFVKEKKGMLRVPFNDLVFVKSSHVYLELHTKNNSKYVVRSNIQDFMQKLPPFFYRCHRSFIVNLNFLSQIETEQLEVNGHMIPISKPFYNELVQRLNKG
jgi:two-component system response regulator LytT